MAEELNPTAPQTGAPETVAPVVASARKKIALLGSAPSSLHLAPFSDPSWEIWGCSGGGAQGAKRVNRWFEGHHFDTTKPLFSAEYLAFLRSATFPVYMDEPHPEVPTFLKFPRDDLLAAFGPFFMTSTIAWMLAFAIHFEGPEEIGLWGIDLAADTEYAYQRPGAHHFISVALHRGIKITVPPESDLMKPPPMYGFAPLDPMTVKAITKTNELAAMRAQAQNEAQAAMCKMAHIEGAIAMNEYWKAIWLSQDPKSVAGG